MDLWSPVMNGVLTALGPHLWWALPALVLVVILRFPMLGRGPNSSRRDPWPGFKFAPRSTVLERAGGQCEAPVLLMWGRCGDPATEVDHVVPWSRGGPTVASNGQALCRSHNRSKGAMVPPWWYMLGLERRRREYFPSGADVKVRAVMSAEERAARERSTTKRRA
ncbi:HNH endonuclease [Agrococcus sp. DT81.2]|uniref:HNH endonuclease n=1 Tax=Agrococcus sp. DT81.2 TaxID=3393414 RepID=UPI003CE525A7